MERTSNSAPLVQSSLMTLPVEVLVYIVSFLSTRDKVIIRCVSRSLRSVSEIPSLWGEVYMDTLRPTWSWWEGIWTRFEDVWETHQKVSLCWSYRSIKARGDVETLQLMHLSLPSFHYYLNFEKLKMILLGMASLQVLNIHFLYIGTATEEIFTLSSNLKEPSYHYEFILLRNYTDWLVVWANFNYVPRKLNFVFTDKPECPDVLISCVQPCLPIMSNKKLSKISGPPDITLFSVCFNDSADLLPVVPYIQLQVTESTMSLPSVKASNYGLLGIRCGYTAFNSRYTL